MAICVTWLREMLPTGTAGNEVAELPPISPKMPPRREAKQKPGLSSDKKGAG